MALHQVSVILLDPVAVFEFGVAVEVFGIDRSDEGIEPFDFRVCGLRPGVPLEGKNLDPFTITATRGLEDVAGSDLVIVSPAVNPRVGLDFPEEVLDTLRAAHAEGATLLSLCTGSFVLGAAGLLDGRRCTTHWMYADEMQRRFPAAQVDPRSLFVEDGPVITSAGTAAGIDASLHLVRRELGAAVASRIARRMVVPPQRDGGQLQFVDNPIPCTADSLAPVLEWATGRLGEDHSVASLSARAVMSERTFARRFLAETGTTPHKWLTQQRVLAARDLLENSDLAVEQVAGRVGFNSAVVLRDHFRRATGLSPQAYRRRFGLLPRASHAE